MLQKKTVLRKLLIAIVLVLSVATLGLIILLFMEQNTQKDPVCRSDACHVIGAAIHQSLDLTADPCQDFYTYCCGGWLKTHEVPSDMKKFGVTEQLENEVLLKINGLLSSNNSSGIAWRNAVKFYNSCMNMTAIERRGPAPLLTYFTRFGGWPLLNKQWQEKDFDWITALTVIQLTTGYGYVIPVIIGTDPKNTSRKLLQLDQPNLLFSEEILRQPNSESSKSQLQKFQKFFTKITVLLGADISNISEYFNSLLEFEIQLFEKQHSGENYDFIQNELDFLKATISEDETWIYRYDPEISIHSSQWKSSGLLHPKEMMSPEENMENISYWYNTMTVGDLQRKIPEINWMRFLQELTNSSLLLLDGKPVIQNEDIIIVRDLPYIQKLSKYLRDVSHIRHIANYLGCRVAMSLMLHLPKDFSDALYEYYGDLGYTFRSPERWKTCTKRVSSFFNQVTVFAYVDKYFPKHVKIEVNKLVLDISFQFEKILLSNDWMDKITKNAALKKLRAMKANVGYPDWIGDENNINDVYVKENMPTMDDKVFENDVKLVEHKVMQLIKTLRLKLEEEWPMSPIEINAGYNRNLNAVTFPAAFLQLPLYDSSLPPYFNYAAIGSIIGHEITHGFDNEGSKRNASGEIDEWWSQKSKAIFEKKTNCFVEQYNRYGLNGKRTLAENIADNGGLRQAYKAFSAWKKNQLATEKLPGLENFSAEQLFFLSYGSIWCTQYAKGMLNYTINESDHAPAPYRLRITTENLEEFSESFKCHAKSRQAVNRCRIW